MAQQKEKNKINNKQRQGDWICNRVQKLILQKLELQQQEFCIQRLLQSMSYYKECQKQREQWIQICPFLTENNGDIHPILDRSNQSSGERPDIGNNKFIFDTLHSIESILKQMTKEIFILSLNVNVNNAYRLINTIKQIEFNVEYKVLESLLFDLEPF
ncbi:unnamed protein product [Paramecium primaurelia]|uniref:Uncharacterized protein n=1 Tax=Paramecium primaurelia TaxID=5886 RepID=A0A8S1L9F1_PARPR|nr:unnamed protein product [Paramecium primaurelia]